VKNNLGKNGVQQYQKGKKNETIKPLAPIRFNCMVGCIQSDFYLILL